MTEPAQDPNDVERLRRIALEIQSLGREGLDLLGKHIQIPDDEVERRPAVPWPDDTPFPLTPAECYWIMRGWSVLPRTRITIDMFDTMPGRLEMLGGWISLSV